MLFIMYLLFIFSLRAEYKGEVFLGLNQAKGNTQKFICKFNY